MHLRVIKRPKVPIAPAARTAREWWSTSARSRWPTPPSGNGQPVMLIPGFLAGEASLSRMAAWLQSGGFTCVAPGMRFNVDCLEPAVAALEQRLEQAVERHGTPALVIGQSRGGVLGRIIAVRRPDLVEVLVTLGSPVNDPLAIRLCVWPTVGALGSLGAAGVPGLFSLRCLNGACCAQARHDLAKSFPTRVHSIALYTRRDEIVRWQACLDPAAQQLEVDATHLGMGLDGAVWQRMATALSEWHPRGALVPDGRSRWHAGRSSRVPASNSEKPIGTGDLDRGTALS
jgi:pimeloyl-ACP methyl ester carboxylesterase